jgi:hypothetical protein
MSIGTSKTMHIGMCKCNRACRCQTRSRQETGVCCDSELASESAQRAATMLTSILVISAKRFGDICNI